MKTYCPKCKNELVGGLGLGANLAKCEINTWCDNCKFYPSNPIIKN